MPYYDYSYGYSSGSGAGGLIAAIVIAVIAGIVLYCTFLARKNEGKFTGFLGWLYDTLSFRNFLIELLLKIFYLIVAIFVTIYAFILLFTPGAGFLTFLILLVGGNIVARILYEFMLLLVMIWRNTNDINKKLGGQLTQRSEPAPRQQAYYQAPSPAPAFCPMCGTKLEEGAAFCPNCGKSVK